MVIDHLGIREWVQVTFHNENDLLGPTACAGLLSRGLIWPPALQIKPNLFKELSGGSMLTGEGGDEVLGARRASPWPHLSRKTPRSRKVALKGAIDSVLPASIRRHRMITELRNADIQPWLKPEVAEAHFKMIADDCTSEPLDWGKSIHWLVRRRSGAATAHNYRLVAAEYGISLLDPLLEPRFLGAYAASGGHFGFASRTEAMRGLFGDLLPSKVIERTTKAAFNRAYLGNPTREFATGWDGSGVDGDLVDRDRLREEWLSDMPSAVSGPLLQSAWLASQANSAQH